VARVRIRARLDLDWEVHYMSDLFRRTAWALALTSSLFIAACDDDDDNGTTPSPITSPTPAPTPTATPTPTPSPTPTPTAGEDVSLLGIVRQVDTGTNTLHVGSTRVHVDGATIIKDLGGNILTLEQLPNGSTVRVKGRSMSDGGVQAEVITLQR
jgi:hypothetical protein